jgi:2-keto-3-deoxy-6-phosphogluconate aldolase
VKTKKETGAVPTASGGILNSEFAKWIAIGGVGGVGGFLAVQQDDVASPFIP